MGFEGLEIGRGRESINGQQIPNLEVPDINERANKEAFHLSRLTMTRCEFIEVLKLEIKA